MTTEQLLTEFLKEIVNGDPMERHTLVKKYTERFEELQNAPAA
jgi:hypothetical protein